MNWVKYVNYSIILSVGVLIYYTGSWHWLWGLFLPLIIWSGYQVSKPCGCNKSDKTLTKEELLKKEQENIDFHKKQLEESKERLKKLSSNKPENKTHNLEKRLINKVKENKNDNVIEFDESGNQIPLWKK